MWNSRNCCHGKGKKKEEEVRTLVKLDTSDNDTIVQASTSNLWRIFRREHHFHPQLPLFCCMWLT